MEKNININDFKIYFIQNEDLKYKILNENYTYNIPKQISSCANILTLTNKQKSSSALYLNIYKQKSKHLDFIKNIISSTPNITLTDTQNTSIIKFDKITNNDLTTDSELFKIIEYVNQDTNIEIDYFQLNIVSKSEIIVTNSYFVAMKSILAGREPIFYFDMSNEITQTSLFQISSLLFYKNIKLNITYSNQAHIDIIISKLEQTVKDLGFRNTDITNYITFMEI